MIYAIVYVCHSCICWFLHFGLPMGRAYLNECYILDSLVLSSFCNMRIMSRSHSFNQTIYA
uniref:Uncharacterized protein n=1 Tax=Arundo donax TaxID=35708 RepID=A0A0A9HED9_ARUDO